MTVPAKKVIIIAVTIKKRSKGRWYMNERQRLFCDCYLESLNAAKAACQAGYLAKNSGSYGRRMLEYPEIQDYLRRAMLERGRELVDSCMDALVAMAESMEVDRGFRETLAYYRDILRIYRLVFGENRG